MDVKNNSKMSSKVSIRPQTVYALPENSTFLHMGYISIEPRPWSAQPHSRGEVSARTIPRLKQQERFCTKFQCRRRTTLMNQETLPQGVQHETFESWMKGSPHDSDEYDTDVEENTVTIEEANIERKRLDSSGLKTYKELCKRKGCVPISFLKRNLGKRSIRMRHHYLGGKSTMPVAVALMQNTITEHLDLGDNCLENEGAIDIALMMKENINITSMILSNNCIGTIGLASLAQMLKSNTTLKSLSLAGNQLQDHDAMNLMEGLKNNDTLIALDLSNNEFGELGGEYMAAALANNYALTNLDLSWNGIRCNGAVTIAKALKTNSTLEVLDLGWNGFGYQGAEALGKILRINTTLKVLDLTNNRIYNKGALKLAMGLKRNFGLELLVLNMNPIGDDAMEAMLKAASIHETLKFLSMEEVAVNEENFRRVKELKVQKEELIIIHGGIGGYTKHTTVASLLQLFNAFIRQNGSHLKEGCQHMDKEQNGILSYEQMNECMMEAGMRFTMRQFQLLLEELDFSRFGHINYKEALSEKCAECVPRRLSCTDRLGQIPSQCLLHRKIFSPDTDHTSSL